jgi:hypothetical protein
VSLKADVVDAKTPLEANKTITNSKEQSSKRTKKSNKPVPVLVKKTLIRSMMNWQRTIKKMKTLNHYKIKSKKEKFQS